MFGGMLAAWVGLALIVEPAPEVAPASEPAPAPQPVVAVELRGPACEGASLGRRVDDLLAESVADDGASTTAVEAMLAEQDGRWSIEIRWGGRSARRLEGATCQTVLDAAAFVIAIAVDPTVAERFVPPADPEDVDGRSDEDETPADESAPTDGEVSPADDPADPSEAVSTDESDEGSEPPSSSAERPLAEPSVTTKTPSDRPLVGAVGLFVGIDGSALPVGAPVGGRLGLLGPAWRVDLRGHYRSATPVEATLDSTVGGRIGGWVVGLRGCWRARPSSKLRPLELPVCGSAEAGQVLGEGFGFDGATSARLPWAAVLGELGAQWVFAERVAVGVEAQLGGSVLGGRLVIDGLGPVVEVGGLVVRGVVSVEVRFGGEASP